MNYQFNKDPPDDYAFYLVIYFFIFYLCCSLYFLLRYGRDSYFLVTMLLLIQITFFILIYTSQANLPHRALTVTLLVLISLVLLTWCYEIDNDYTLYYGYFFVIIGLSFATVGWWNDCRAVLAPGLTLAVLSSATIGFDLLT